MADQASIAASETSQPSPPERWAPFAPPSHAASIGWQWAGDESSLPTTTEPSLSERTTPKKGGRKRPRPSSAPSSEVAVDRAVKDNKTCRNQKDSETAATDSSSKFETSELPKQVTLSWSSRGTAILTFTAEPVLVCLVGRTRIQIVRGQVDLLGYRLAADSPNDAVSVDSPTWRSVVTITNIPVTHETNTILHLTSLCEKDTDRPTFRVCASTSNDLRPTIVPHTWQLAMDEIVCDMTNNESLQEAPPGNGHDACRDVYGGDSLEPDENDVVSCPSSPPMARIVICGAKGVGKSTCLRYAAHRLLSDRYKAVALLDCDAGQPELSPPGMLTLTMIVTPLLHPPHVHMVMGPDSVVATQHVEAYFYGHTTSKADPTLYVQSITKLLQRYVQLVDEEYDGDEYQLPLLVNTDGWVKGMGFQVLSALLDVIRPRHVVQLIGENRSKIFDLTQVMELSTESNLHVVHAYNNSSETLSTVSTGVSATSRTSSVTSLVSMEGNVDTFSAPTTPNASTPVNAASIPSLALRSLRLCTYLLGATDIWDSDDVHFGMTGIFDPNCRIAQRLAAARPYIVPMEAVKYDIIRGCDAQQDLRNDDMVLDVLNGSIVGLCRSVETPSKDTSREGNPEDELHGPILKDAETQFCPPCLGLGLVRSIDRARRLFYILTPVDSEVLQSVNVLVGGNVQTPIECLYRGVQSEAFPYLCCDGLSIGIGADFMKSRNSLMRRRASP